MLSAQQYDVLQKDVNIWDSCASGCWCMTYASTQFAAIIMPLSFEQAQRDP